MQAELTKVKNRLALMENIKPTKAPIKPTSALIIKPATTPIEPTTALTIEPTTAPIKPTTALILEPTTLDNIDSAGATPRK
jgi:hypothetical protein